MEVEYHVCRLSVVLPLGFGSRDSDSKKVKNDCYRPGEEERPKIQLRDCNGTQQEEVEFQKQESGAGCDGGVVRCTPGLLYSLL
uniref:VPS53 subunit of GARP complex n=1 Tax=Myotis myotis TaxID=51298 RepID=A0A7J7T9E4_MYOMY|nr:VPS53 subunit of GARP complex [Myotis myotis]